VNEMIPGVITAVAAMVMRVNVWVLEVGYLRWCGTLLSKEEIGKEEVGDTWLWIYK